MAKNISIFPFGRRAGTRCTEERRQLAESLGQTQIQIKQAYSGFNNEKDRDLIESYVFEINSLLCRYNYLLRRIKELDEEETAG